MKSGRLTCSVLQKIKILALFCTQPLHCMYRCTVNVHVHKSTSLLRNFSEPLYVTSFINQLHLAGNCNAENGLPQYPNGLEGEHDYV